MPELNLRGKFVNAFGRLCGRTTLQKAAENLELLANSAMNVGGATLDYQDSGETTVMHFLQRSRSSDYDWTLFDVGAHKGDYAEWLRVIFGENARIFCFEPSRHLFDRLSARNGEKLHCEIFELALGERTEEVTLFSAENDIPSILPNAFEITGQEITARELVKTIRFDEFCLANNIEHVDFLKVDVEGFEMNVLKGAGEWIDGLRIDFIQFEFGPHAVASRTYFRDFYSLLNPRYRIFRVLRRGLHELRGYHVRHERFSSATNYLAVSKSINVNL